MIAEKLIKELEIVTGVKADLIDYMADTVIYEACYGDQSGIPEISLDYFQMLIKKLQPNSFEDLVQLACLCHDTDAWMPVQMHIMDVYPIATAEQIKKLMGRPVGAAPERKKAEKPKENKKGKVSYPQNLLKDMNTDIKNPSDDQILGLEFAIGQLKESDQEVIRLRYEQGLTFVLVPRILKG